MAEQSYKGSTIFRFANWVLYPIGQVDRHTAVSAWIGSRRYKIDTDGHVTPLPRDRWSTVAYVLEGSPAHEEAVKQIAVAKERQEHDKACLARVGQGHDLLRRIAATRSITRLDNAVAALTALLPETTP